MKKYFLLVISFALLSLIMKAQPPIPNHEGKWIVDDANVISESTENTISNLCKKEFDSTSNQIVVYVFSSLEGSTIEKYANEVFNKWEVGTKENNNGVLLIVAINDRQMRIEVGYGLESHLTDLEASDIIENEIKPNFKEGDFDRGVLNGVQNIIYGIKNSYVAPYKYLATNPVNKPSVDLIYFILFVVWLGIGLFSSRMTWAEGITTMIFAAMFIFIFVYMIYGGMFGSIMALSGTALMILLRIFWKPKRPIKFWSTANSGGGSWSSSSSSSSYSSSSYNSGSSWSSGGGGGGFSGGGGSSGGGGASGSW